MNQYVENIETKLSDTSLVKYLEDFSSRNPTHSFAVNSVSISVEQTLDDFNYIKEILLASIGSGMFEKLPVPSQHNLSNQVTSLYSNKTDANKLTSSVQNLYYHLTVNGLEYKLENFDRFKNALKDISNLKRNFSRTIKSLEQSSDNIKKLNELRKEIQEIHVSVDTRSSKIFKQIENTEITLKRTDEHLKKAKDSEQIIENSKKEILAFKENVDSYKKDVQDSNERTKLILGEFEDKREEVEKLIKKSEEALKLKASEGMSAALSAQYEEEGKIEKRRQWLYIATGFILLTLFGLGLLVFEVSFGEKLINPEGPNAIIARIIFVGVTIAGASFAAKQYLNQKRLADNYAYKLVLAKSIVAFAQEIKKHDPDKAAEYMTNVLNELNRSPLSKENSEESINSTNITMLEKLQSLLKP